MAASIEDLCFSSLVISSSSPITNSKKPYFDFLPDELFVEIILRLPENHVHRYKCVSQRWLAIISSDNFIKSYIHYNACLHNSKPPFALFYEQRNLNMFGSAYSEHPVFNSPGFSLDFLPFPCTSFFYILSSSNGLLLCVSTKDDKYYVCNPLTKQWITPLPRPPTIAPCIDTGFVCKSTSSGCIFRIVHIPNRVEFNREVVIYDSESREWTKVILNKRFLFDEDYAPRNEAVTCNGLIHWKNNTGCISIYDSYNDGENCKIIGVPNHKSLTRNKNKIKSTIGVCKERFRYLEWGREDFLLWELEDYDNEIWRLVQEFCINEMEIENPMVSSNCVFNSVVIHPFDEDILFLQRENEIIRCNTRLKKMVIVGKLNGRLDLCISPTKWFPITLPWWPISLPLN